MLDKASGELVAASLDKTHKVKNDVIYRLTEIECVEVLHMGIIDFLQPWTTSKVAAMCPCQITKVFKTDWVTVVACVGSVGTIHIECTCVHCTSVIQTSYIKCFHERRAHGMEVHQIL